MGVAFTGQSDPSKVATTEDDFLKIVQSFYSTFLEYFAMWEPTYAPFRLFSWIFRVTISSDVFEKSLGAKNLSTCLGQLDLTSIKCTVC